MDAYVLYFGGDYISLTHAGRGVNKTYAIKSTAKMPYSGIVNGEFVNGNEVPRIVERLLDEVKVPTVFTINVAVPSCFSSARVGTYKKTFTKPRTVTQKDADELLMGGRAIYYRVDGGAPIIDAVEHTVNRELEVQVSHIETSPMFTEILRRSLAKYKKLRLLPVSLCEAKYLIDQTERDRTCVLLSCKMFSTTVSVVAGDQLCAVETFNMGTAHIVNDISIMMHMEYNKARELFGKNDKNNPITRARLEDMAEQVVSIEKGLDTHLLKHKFYMCGGHADAVAGAKEIFETALGVKITVLGCPLTEQNLPDKTSIDAVILNALN